MSEPARAPEAKPKVDDDSHLDARIALHHRSRQLLHIIMATLLVWGSIHALGAYLYNHDWRKPVVVYVCLIGFLGFWWLMLALRDRRLRRGFEKLPDR